MKVCSKCGEEKSLDQFYKSSKTKSGYRSPCKSCINTTNKTYYVNHRTQVNEYKRNWALANNKNKRERENIWYLSNAEWVRKCSQCKEEKPSSEFHRSSGAIFGRMASCKTCQSAKQRQYYSENLNFCRESRKQYYENNRLSFIIRARLRRRNIRYQTPKWLTFEQRREIELIYEHARECSMLTGDQYAVDHIVPLRGKNVCGLHVPWNLQVLPTDLNDSKGNKLIEELAVAHV